MNSTTLSHRSLFAGLALCIVVSGARAQQCELELVPPGGGQSGNFGTSVSFDGVTALLGAQLADGAAVDSGAAWAFSGVDFADVEQLSASDGDPGDLFGSSAAVAGDVIVVGAVNDSDVVFDGGSAYVFERVMSDWVEVAKLTDPNATDLDSFGASVAVSGDIIAVGAPWDDDLAANAGSVFVFHRSGGTWMMSDQLTASDGSVDSRFGYSIALEGGRLVVGAPYAHGNADSVGAAYVFEGAPGAWTETAKLHALDGQSYDDFGESVSLSNDTIVVGSRDDDLMGSAYVFERLAAGWVQADKLTPPDRGPNDQVGKSVSIDGDLLVVGAPAADGYSVSDGAAYLYERHGTTWNLAAKLAASEAFTPMRFAWSVAVAGETVIAGAPWGIPLMPDPGYAFTKDAFGWVTCGRPIGIPYCGPAAANSSGAPASLIVHGFLEIDVNLFTLLASDLPVGEFGYVLTSRTPGLFTPPGSAGFLCLGGSIGRFNRASEILQGPTDALAVDLTALPLSPPQPAQIGETWNFQCWFRDGATSNFSDGVRVVFR